MFKVQLMVGMIVLAQEKATNEVKEIVFLGNSPSGEYIKIRNLSGSGEIEWLKKEDFDKTYELVELLGY